MTWSPKFAPLDVLESQDRWEVPNEAGAVLEEGIVGTLRAADKGEKPLADLCREDGIAEQTLQEHH